MALIPVLVECYAGSKAYERPRRIVIDGSAHEVIRATAFYIDEDAVSRLRRYRVEVLIEGSRKLVLIRQGDQWFLEQQ